MRYGPRSGSVQDQCLLLGYELTHSDGIYTVIHLSMLLDGEPSCPEKIAGATLDGIEALYDWIEKVNKARQVSGKITLLDFMRKQQQKHRKEI